jgi:voltage-gated potassium channel
VQTLLGNGVTPNKIVVVDSDPNAVAEANGRGLVGVVGDGSRTEVLERAGIAKAKHVIVAAQRDDAAVLTTLTVRHLNRTAVIIASVREDENVPLLRESGANTVITSADAAGQLLGVATLSPKVGEVVQDLLSYGSGLEIVERPADDADVGLPPRNVGQPVLAVVRGSRTMRYDDPSIGSVELSDRLIVVRSVGD